MRALTQPSHQRAWLRQQWSALFAATLLLFLCVQPILCIIHCTADAHLSPAEIQVSQRSFFLCSLAQTEPEAPHLSHIPLPAFWPSLPAILPAIIFVLLALMLIRMPAPQSLVSLRWSPPLPPPR
ncbi:hypothetical protein OSCT_1432 [Oscillochloris trichoides DG-6]|uniref:Uncharacterized protein n=1 Tax=Oscillochloris trichoides DG-6 TaxID=765420 RepID=E1IDN1_9CHLR|nr:hypothetical protein [Oscillochloris trichoides]EFO80739.1 hypothetical protein OSCT_1432 [Oscillochloris trichoides DG-6]